MSRQHFGPARHANEMGAIKSGRYYKRGPVYT